MHALPPWNASCQAVYESIGVRAVLGWAIQAVGQERLQGVRREPWGIAYTAYIPATATSVRTNWNMQTERLTMSDRSAHSLVLEPR